jgi:hypothetical protein
MGSDEGLQVAQRFNDSAHPACMMQLGRRSQHAQASVQDGCGREIVGVR